MPDVDSTFLGPYRVLRPLGQGGMGEVLLAYDPRLDRRVAIKRILTKPDEASRERFRREARLSARLNHAAIVQVYDLVTLEDTDHLVMEYVPGTSLRELLNQRALTIEEGLRIARHLAEGLAYAHRHGIIHRDLKTDNVLIDEDGQAKISDFGLARLLAGEPEEGNDRLTLSGAVLGTCRSMSPEQACGDPVDTRSDLFSFGVLLYELFTRQSPFRAKNNVQTLHRVIHLRQAEANIINPQISAELSSLLDRLLEKNPLARPRDADEVAVQLRQIEAAVLMDSDSTHFPATDETATIGGPVTPLPTPKTNTGRPFVGGAAPPTTSNAEEKDGAERAANKINDGDTGVSKKSKAGMLLAILPLLLLALTLLRPTATRNKKSPGQTPALPLSVAVLKPVVVATHDATSNESADESAADSLLPFTVRHAVMRSLSTLEGISAKTTAEVDAVGGLPMEVARAVAADEVVTSSLACREANCWVELSRVSATDGVVRWSEQMPVPGDELLAAARGVDNLVRRGFREFSPRPGQPEVRVSAADYATYLNIRRAVSIQASSTDRDLLLSRLREIRRRSENFLDAYLLEAEILMFQYPQSRRPELLDQALTLLKTAEEIAPQDPAPRFSRIYLALEAHDLAKAEAELEALEQLVPGDARILDLRAQLLDLQGHPERALALYRLAVDRRPSWLRLYNYARLLTRMGETTLARDSLNRLLERFPGSRVAMELLANLELTHGSLDRSIELYEKLLLDSATPRVLTNLGLAYVLAGEPSTAAEVSRKAVEAAPDHPSYLLNLADARFLQGETDEAMDLYRQVLSMLDAEEESSRPQLLTVRAQALAHLGELLPAVEAIQQAVRQAPDNANVIFEAALVYAVVGDQTTALFSAQKALELGMQERFFQLPWFDEVRRHPGFPTANDGV